jgi:hypothetical protein
MDYRAVRDESLRRLQGAGVPEHPNLPLLDECPRRSAEEAARRVVALYCLSGLANGAIGPVMLEWIAEQGLEPIFEPSELDLLARRELREEQLNHLSWCQESLYAAAWSLSLVKDMAWPDTECDLEPVFPRIPPQVGPESFFRGATLRGDREIVQAADVYYCLDASLRKDALWGGARVESRYPMVQIVMERRRALDWLMQDGAWSDVVLDT